MNTVSAPRHSCQSQRGVPAALRGPNFTRYRKTLPSAFAAGLMLALSQLPCSLHAGDFDFTPPTLDPSHTKLAPKVNRSRGWLDNYVKEKVIKPAEKAGGELSDSTKKEGAKASDWTKKEGAKASNWTKKEGAKASDWTKKEGGKASDWTKQAGGKASDWTKKEGAKASNWTKKEGGKAGYFLGEETAGELGRRLFPLAAKVQAARHATKKWLRLTPRERKALKLVHGSLVDNASIRVVYGADPLNDWNNLDNSIKEHIPVGSEASAQTFGFTIYIKDARDLLTDFGRLSLLTHELTHVQQFLRFGASLEAYGYQYFKASAKTALRHEDPYIDASHRKGNALEVEAYRVQDTNERRVYDYYRANPPAAIPGSNKIPTTKMPAPAPSVPRKTIKCEFTNTTKDTVYFRLNGGKGLSMSLAPGKTTMYSVVVDAGTPPAVFIQQKNGTEGNFALKDGDKYAFIRNGKIANAYK